MKVVKERMEAKIEDKTRKPKSFKVLSFPGWIHQARSEVMQE
jgi:hypothetical protein